MFASSALRFVYYKNQVYVDCKISRGSKIEFIRKEYFSWVVLSSPEAQLGSGLGARGLGGSGLGLRCECSDHLS